MFTAQSNQISFSEFFKIFFSHHIRQIKIYFINLINILLFVLYKMNKTQLITGLKNYGFSEEILRAFEKVPRENFVPESLKEYAYYDDALPLEEGATISQPYTIAFMLNLLELKKESKEGEKQRILEIGSGSGYVLALLSEITKGEIYGLEIIESLAEKSKKILKKYKNITVYNKDGSKGLPEKAPLDRILISAAADEIPKHLFFQLEDKGILVAPVGNSIFQIKKEKGKIRIKEFPGFVFVPLRDG